MPGATARAGRPTLPTTAVGGATLIRSTLRRSALPATAVSGSALPATAVSGAALPGAATRAGRSALRGAAAALLGAAVARATRLTWVCVRLSADDGAWAIGLAARALRASATVGGSVRTARSGRVEGRVARFENPARAREDPDANQAKTQRSADDKPTSFSHTRTTRRTLAPRKLFFPNLMCPAPRSGHRADYPWE